MNHVRKTMKLRAQDIQVLLKIEGHINTYKN